MSTTTPVEPVDLADAALVEDPYPHYARLRAAGAPVRSAVWDCWFVGLHAHCHAVFGDDRFSAVGQPMLRGLQAAVVSGARSYALPAPPPVTGAEAHRAQGRRTTGRALATAHVDRLWPGFAAACRERAADLVTRSGPVDIVAGYAVPLATRLLADLMAVGESDLPVFRAWAESGYHPCPDETARRRVVRDIRALLARTAVGRLREPTGDFVGYLAAHPGALTADSGVGAHLEFVLGTGLMISLVTHQGLVFSFGTLVDALARHPGQYARVHADRSLVAAAVEEGLRHDPSTQVLGRLARTDAVVGGTEIPAGGLVLCLVGSANRDPAQWPHADTFDVGRDTRAAARHLTFGLGATSCLGAAMARQALGHMLAALVAAAGELAPAPGAVRFPEFTTRGYTALPVQLTSARSHG